MVRPLLTWPMNGRFIKQRVDDELKPLSVHRACSSARRCVGMGRGGSMAKNEIAVRKTDTIFDEIDQLHKAIS